MLRDKNMIAAQLRSKIRENSLIALVTEAFMNGLPLNSAAIANEQAQLQRYAITVLRKMNLPKVLDSALESTTGLQHDYLVELNNSVNEIANEAAKRILSERTLSDTTTPEIIKQADLDEKETKKLIKASDNSGIKSVANVVQKKVLDTIKADQKAYDESEDLKEKIKSLIHKETSGIEKDPVGDPNSETQSPNDEFDGETVAPSDASASGENEEMPTDEDDAAVESYCRIVLSPTDVRHPISFFSRVNDVCMEAILHSTEVYTGEIPYETLGKVTLESTLPYFDLSRRTIEEDIRSMQLATEATVCDDCTPEEKAIKMKKIAKTAFICSICIMTLMETLKTMNLRSPTMGEVKDFVDAAPKTELVTDPKLNNLEDKIGKGADEIKKSVALGALTAVETAQAKESFARLQDMLLNTEVPASQKAQKDRILASMESALKSNLKESKSYDQSGYFNSRDKEHNITAMEVAIKRLNRRPTTASIRIAVESNVKSQDNLDVTLEACALNAVGVPIAENSFTLHAYPLFGSSVSEIVQECAQYVNVGIGSKPISLYFNDKNYSVPLQVEYK